MKAVAYLQTPSSGTRRSVRRGLGFTLPELLLALAIGALLLGLAAPSFERTFRQWTLLRTAQSVLAAAHQARSSAAARALPVVLCQTDAPGHCGAAGSVVSGWQLFVAHSMSSPPRLSPGDELLQVLPLPADIELRSNRTALTWWPSARAGTTATLVFCDPRARALPRTLIVSQSGRPRLDTRLADGSAPDCGHG